MVSCSAFSCTLTAAFEEHGWGSDSMGQQGGRGKHAPFINAVGRAFPHQRKILI
jgi:hypothetical protein